MSKRQANIVAQLRRAIRQAERSGQSRYAIAKASGITPIMLSRFADGERGVNLATAERIAVGLGMSLTLLPKRVISADRD